MNARTPIAATMAIALIASGVAARQDRPAGQGFSFRTGVELISVSVTVTDANGHFIPGLKREDFTITEDGQPQTISQFDAERVPVSLGILLDTSGSMVGDKIVAAERALNRFLFDLLGERDEVFLYTFDSHATLVKSWTTDRKSVSRALGEIKPFGGTAMYDAVAEAVPLAEHGSNRKKAIVVISDGNDMNSRTRIADVQRRVRESEVLVYAIGIDADGMSQATSRPGPNPASAPTNTKPTPSPFPGAATSAKSAPAPVAPASSGSSTNARVNATALRSLTDDTGGRTEVILSPRDLDPATAGIASELNRQYYLGYVTPAAKDGKWHTIEVTVRGGSYTIRARKGFISG